MLVHEEQLLTVNTPHSRPITQIVSPAMYLLYDKKITETTGDL